MSSSEANLSMTTLYLVPIPPGDPDDISMRALRILGEAGAVAADDAGAGRALLERYAITTAVVGYADAFAALERGDVALISTRGTPGLGAGREVVQAAIAQGVQVVPLPGADAVITALVLAGLPTDAFVYAGTLPNDLNRWANERATLVFRSGDAVTALARIVETLGDRRVALVDGARLDAAIYRGMAGAASLPADLGDALIVVEGAPEPAAAVWDEARVRAELRGRLDAGEPLKLAAKAVANAAGWERREVYRMGVEMKESFD